MTNVQVELSNGLEEIEKELQHVVATHNEEVQEFQAEINKAEEEAQKAKEHMAEAKKGDNPKEYAQAVAEQRTANDIVGFYEGKLNKLKSEPLITEDEYREYTRRIKSEMDKINKQASNRASELIEELEAIQSELNPAHTKTNELLNNLQNSIYKHSAEKQMAEARATGKAVKGIELHNEYKDDTLRGGINNILSSPGVKNIKAKGNR